jgi:hypothetical protein
VNPEPSRDGDLVTQFNASLSLDQLKQIRSDSIVYVRDLSRTQQGVVKERIDRTMFAGAADKWRKMMTDFQMLPTSSFRLEAETAAPQSRPGAISRSSVESVAPLASVYRLYLDLSNGERPSRRHLADWWLDLAGNIPKQNSH